MKKIYGKSQKLKCPLCGTQATTRNSRKLPTCSRHSNEDLNFKCSCGSYMDVKESKHGTFFLCINCGPVSYERGLEVNNLPLPSVENL